VFVVVSVKNYENVKLCEFQKPKKGNRHCGDSVFTLEDKSYFICAVADGLGSGKEAQASSKAAIDVVRLNHHKDVSEIIQECNASLKGKRGAVLAVFKFFYDKNELIYSSIGNIQLRLYSASSKKIIRPVPTSGFLTGRPQEINVQRFSLDLDIAFIIYTDGLKNQVKKEELSSLTSPESAALQIARKIDQPEDDVTFLVGKIST
jgi:negative regulator of sigma-B (phosphoserine phosphatase)